MIKETTGVNPPIVENIPAPLVERPQWVNWRLEAREGKETKVPYTPGTLCGADSTDLMTWRTFEEAVQALEAGSFAYDGIGYVISADPYVGIDLDNCRDPKNGNIAPWAQRIIASVREGYVEISPSGTGVHILVEGTVRGGRTQRKVPPNGKIEMYGRDRFFTITGWSL